MNIFHNVMYSLHSELRPGPVLQTVALAAALWAAGCDSNEAPVAMDSIPGQSVAIGETATVSLDQYFRDADGDPLTFDATSGAPAVATASVSGQSLTVTGVSQGTAEVTVTANDAEGLSATQRFTATVPNRAPTVSSQIPDAEVFVGEILQVDLSEHFADMDGDELLYAATSSDDEVATALVSDSTGQGVATVTVTATDPGGLSVEQSFAVTVPNRGPIVSNPIPDAEAHVGDAVEVELSGHFADPDGDELSYTATSSDDEVATATASGASLTVAGVGQGTATVTVTATDPGGLSVEQGFTVTVPNRAPEVSDPIPDAELHVGETIDVDLSGHFADPDGDDLSYAATSSDEGVATASAAGASLTVAAVGQGSARPTPAGCRSSRASP
ncbi:MAG: Ig-like domain-containing protein [Gemmatimonadetes bacterium]|nr:Ig-like domain-containing protein [Gemmatimonadota bacterium]